MVNIDLWYGDTDVKGASVSFSDIDLEYRGNLFDKNGKVIGDFSSPDSVELEEFFKENYDLDLFREGA